MDRMAKILLLNMCMIIDEQNNNENAHSDFRVI